MDRLWGVCLPPRVDGGMLNRVLHFIDSFSDWSGKIASVLVFGILGVLLYEIVARYLFNAPTLWAHETSGFIFGFYFLLGAAYCLRTKGHVSVDILYDRLSTRTQAILDVVTFVLFLAVCITLIWYGGKAAANSWRLNEHTSSLWGPPLYPLRTVVPIGALLLLIQGVGKFVRDFTTAVTGKSHNARG
ncbi:MAG: TRAP transporter small permease subunit [Desulfobacteraceae bacterium]|nr:TRAP transporter small permease subunit [Desulfobacteraceae bacterium]